MEPLIALVAVAALALAARRPALLALRLGVAAMFTLTGVAHFVGLREELVAMVPPALPAPELLVTISGVLELLGAAGMMIAAVAPWAAAGLTAMLVAMFPANVHLALTGTDLPFMEQLWPRTLLQIVFLAATSTVVVAHWRRARATAGPQEQRPGQEQEGRTRSRTATS